MSQRECICPQCGRIGRIAHTVVKTGPDGRIWLPRFRCVCGFEAGDKTVEALAHHLANVWPQYAFRLRKRIERWLRAQWRRLPWTRQVAPPPPLSISDIKGIENAKRLLARMNRSKFKGASRNGPCPCGSGKKYKQCCMRTHGRGR